ncbi:MAG: MBL fold metallo-hydrolase [Gemmatimonadetes bacterium]|nr:MBL fold metallo-hydrolase [Gemmatimonadota bacterium]NNL30700.1 MBL fold metallo-hydrolase [Gemmatimonadota bacterium]
MRRVVLACIAVAFLAGCRLGPGVEGLVDLAPPGSDSLRLVYLGTGGWIMEHGDDQIMTAPLFSNPGVFRTGLWTIAADTTEIDRWMSQHDVGRTSVILSGHAHYDHLMDVPRVALRHSPRARILGNRTVANTLSEWSGVADRMDVVEESEVADHADGAEAAAMWRHYGNVRILPLRSHHAPHFDGYTLYQGTRDFPLEAAPTLAGEWLDGNTLAFLIDFLDDAGEVAFRIYYQDAVVAPPLGFAPDALIAERPVDVAIFVPATFDQVDWHPEAFVENLDPDRVLLGHWEDFFVPVDAPTRSIFLSDIGHFEDRLEHVFDGPFWRPEIGTEFRFPRR